MSLRQELDEPLGFLAALLTLGLVSAAYGVVALFLM